MKKNKKTLPGTIVRNKKAGHDYILSEKTEAGLKLEGWEVKALRAGKVNLTDAYCQIHNGELYLMGVHISPLNTAVKYLATEEKRPRKLLLKRREIDKLVGLAERQGFSILATALYWKGSWAKVEIALGKGKKLHDKRQSAKEKDWARDKSRALKAGV